LSGPAGIPVSAFAYVATGTISRLLRYDTGRFAPWIFMALTITTRVQAVFATTWLLCMISYPTLAAEAPVGNGATGTGHAEALLIAQVVALIVVGRLLGEVLQRFGQPALVGQLLAGLILGPSLLGAIWPQAQHALFPNDAAQKGMIDGLSQIGILLLLLLTGMETDLRLVKKAKGAAIAVSIAGVAVPFLGGFALGQFLPDALLPPGSGRLVPSLFLGTALAISSVKIVAMVVREMNFMRRGLGQVIVASAIIEDTVGWVIIAITFGIAGQDKLDLLSIAKTVAGVALFLVFSFTLGRRIVFSIIRWANDSFRSEFPVITAILVIMGAMALMTQALGVHTVLGAFIAGVLIGESPILTDHIQGQLRGLIAAFFMPIFFGLSGLSADLTVIFREPQLLFLTGVVIAIASIGKFAGAFAGAKMGGLTIREGVALGCAMNARGSTEVVVASIGLSMGALTQNLYTMIVTMAMLTTLAMPPMLRAALARVPLRDEEKKRIAREEVDESGFLPSLERLLLAVDQSAAGKFTARLAGLIAGAHGMPVTIVPLGGEVPEGTAQSPGAVANAVKSGAKSSAAKVIADDAEPDPERVHLTQLADPVADGPETTVREEVRKGYDMMLIGVDACCEADGGFTPQVSSIAGEFTGNVALLARGEKTAMTLNRNTRILVAVNGTEISRHAAELAFALARATGARVTAVYAASKDRKRRTQQREQEVLKDVSHLAERYGVPLSSRIVGHGDAARAILGEAARGYGLIVMGVSARPGRDLYFGNTATLVLLGLSAPVLFLANKPAERAAATDDKPDSAAA
jgi:Kef-type K+ transport system membrane component KefB/nucleotide-binding universal stress UspA family protein